jgi:hypothetical protein
MCRRFTAISKRRQVQINVILTEAEESSFFRSIDTDGYVSRATSSLAVVSESLSQLLIIRCGRTIAQIWSQVCLHQRGVHEREFCARDGTGARRPGGDT